MPQFMQPYCYLPVNKQSSETRPLSCSSPHQNLTVFCQLLYLLSVSLCQGRRAGENPTCFFPLFKKEAMNTEG